MKKILTLTAFLGWTASCVFGASLTMVKPNGGEHLLLGKIYQIQWTAVGINEKVKLILFKNNTKLGIIAQNLSTTPSVYSWEAGKYEGGIAPHGTDYTVRVRTMGNGEGDFSDAFFYLETLDQSMLHNLQIAKKPGFALDANFFPIAVTSPHANGQYAAGQPLHIAWNKDIGVTGYIRMILLDDTGAELESKPNIGNTGTYDGWTPDSKYTWPGRKFRIRLTIKDPGNAMHGSGESGLFSIIPPPPVQKVTRTLARNGETETTQTRQYQDEGIADCLGASHPLPGRAPGTREIKVGHHVASGRHGECDWYEAYYFKGIVGFDLDEIKGKEIVEAKLLVSLGEFQEKVPQGTLATNEECDANCDVYVKDSNFPGGILTSFAIFGVGENKSLDVTQAVKHWAAGNPNNGLLFRAKLDHSNYSESVCLKYYGTMFLTVKYIEYK